MLAQIRCTQETGVEASLCQIVREFSPITETEALQRQTDRQEEEEEVEEEEEKGKTCCSNNWQCWSNTPAD